MPRLKSRPPQVKRSKSRAITTQLKVLVAIIVMAILILPLLFVKMQQSTEDRSRAATAQVAPGLQVVGTKLTATDGSRFVIAGVNMEYFRDPGCSYVTTNTEAQAPQIVAELKSIGVNAVRLNYSASWLGQTGNMTKFRAFMKLLAQNGIYVMPSDHSFTGKVLSGYQTTSFPLFKQIVEGARADGIEAYLIMNPYNEPYGENETASTWSAWITANKATIDYIRTTLGFKGVIVLDTKDWAANFDVPSMQSMITYDATINGGRSNMVFSNHWYPNIAQSNIDNSINNSGTVPVLIGEIGQYNATPLDPGYVKTAFSKVLSTGISKGHNGVFPWIWSWCDDNNMTAAWDDLSHVNAFGQLIIDNYYSKVSNVSTTAPAPSVAPTPIPTVVPVTPVPSSTPGTGGTSSLKVQGTTLVQGGSRFVVKGVNLELFRDQGCGFITSGQVPQRTQIAQKMKSLGINAVRVNYYSGWLGASSQNLTDFLDVMQALAQQGIYVMPSDHAFTGESLSGRSSSYPLFKQIVEGARARGFENMLIMNPYNEPGPQDSWSAWVSANKDTLSYLRGTAKFKGVVVLDTLSWAAAFDDTAMLEVKAYDATLMGGVSDVVFSNHWYPNISMDSVNNSVNMSGTVPVLIGELGQINPGSSGLTPSYVTNVVNAVLNTGVAKGHNGIFAWIWNWCDENGMTNDDFLTLNTFGTLVNNNFYKKGITGVPTPSPTPSVPTPSPTPQPTATPKASVSPVPTPSPTPRATVSPSPTAVPTVQPSVSPSPIPTQSIGNVSLEVKITEQWNTGYCAQLLVKNGTSKEIKNWAVTFNLNQSKITSSWGGKFLTVGSNVVVIPESWAGWLPARGANGTMDFCANKTGNNWRPKAGLVIHL